MSIKLYGEFAKHLKSNGGKPAALFDKLDAVNKSILLTLALNWAEERRVTVLQTMVILPAISTTTAHRRLKELRVRG